MFDNCEAVKGVSMKGLMEIEQYSNLISISSSSFLECAEGKAYNEKIQFVHKHIMLACKRANRTRATLVDLVCIEELEEDKAEE
jgi:hypothetical protein